MKKFFVFVFLFFYASSYAQKLSLSDPIDINFRNDDFAVIGMYKNYYAFYVNNSSSAQVVLYNKNFDFEKRIPIPFISKNTTNPHFVSNEKELVFFFEEHQNKETILYASKLKEDFTFTQPIEIITTKDRSTFKFCSSENNQKILVYNYTKDATDWLLKAIVINTSLVIENTITQTIPSNDFYFLNEQAITNNGTAYFLCKNDLSNKGFSDNLKIATCKNNEVSFSFSEVALSDHSLADLQLKIDNKTNNLYLAGFYTEGKRIAPNGVFYLLFDEKQTSQHITHFTPLTQQMSNNMNDLRNFRISEFSLMNDGGIELSVEKYFQQTKTISYGPTISMNGMMGTQTTRTIQEYNYNEVVIFNLKNDGSLAWSQTLLKNQQTQDDGGIYSSFGFLQHKLGNIYFFNDMNSKNNRLMACYASGKGVLSLKEIQTNEEVNDWSLMPRSAKQISATEIMMPCIKNNQVAFLKISY